MIIIENAANEKAKFRKMFKEFTSLYIMMKPNGNKVDIRFSGESHHGARVELKLVANADYTSNLRNTIYLPFVDYNDCVFDLIFDKDGFYLELYKNNYQGIKTINEQGTEGYISTVIFKTRRKTTHFTAPCNRYTDMIQ